MGGVYGGEYSNLVECILLLFLGEVVHFYFLEGVGMGIGDTLYFID